MPTTVVDIDLTAEIAALPRPTFTDVAVVGTAETAPPNASFGAVNRYSSVAEVETDYGPDSDVATASAAVRAEGASEWYVLVLEEIHVTDEVVADGTAVANAPVLGEVGVTAASRSVVYTVEDPVSTPASGEVAVNTKTGEVATDDGTDATLSYAYVPSWSDGLAALEAQGVDRMALADVGADRRHVGDLDAIATWASGADVGVPVATRDGREFADDAAAMAAAHDVAGAVSSGDAMAIAHKADADVASHVLGQLATNDPWFDPFFDGSGYAFASDSFRQALVGDPATTGTFEGGDSNGDGPVNVVITKAGTEVLSNSLSTAGAGSDYQFFDVAMTETYVATIVERALESLRLREDRVPFTADGRTMIASTIRSALDGATGGPDDPLASYALTVPPIDALSDADRSNRVWSGIEIEGVLSGNVHEFGLELTVTV